MLVRHSDDRNKIQRKIAVTARSLPTSVLCSDESEFNVADFTVQRAQTCVHTNVHGSNFGWMPSFPPPMTHRLIEVPTGVEPRFAGLTLTSESRPFPGTQD